MSGGRRTSKNYRQPSRKEVAKIYHLGFSLGELFDEDELMDFMKTARQRIIAAFYYATEPNPRYRSGHGMKRRRGTDNYIIGIAGKQRELVHHIVDKMKQVFITDDELPDFVTDLHPMHIQMIRRKAQFDVIECVLNLMARRGEVRYDHGYGIWQINQSNIDEYLVYRGAARTALKVDDRSYHGMVRSQSKRRGRPEGVSVSFA